MGDRTRHPPRSPAGLTAIREILRRWPVVLLITLLAVAGALVASLSRDASYSARVQLLVTPLPQYDEVFLGTSLVRDAGDAARTASTLATTLDTRAVDTTTAERLGRGWSPDRVRAAVGVAAVDNVNVVEIAATGADRTTAARLATTFVTAALDVRWRTISQELRERIVALDALREATSGSAVLLRDREILATTLRIGRDPTLRIQDAAPVVSEEGPGTPLIVALAVVGGLILGALAALGASRPWRRRDDDRPPPAP